MKWLALLALAAACGAPRTPTPGGLVVKYTPNEPRLSNAKARELDARYAALLDCLPPEAQCTDWPPTFSIEGRCDTFVDYGYRVRGVYIPGPGLTGHIILPGSLGAAAHEMAHHFACEVDGGPNYANTWLRKCGDTIDQTYRRLYPPVKCEGEK